MADDGLVIEFVDDDGEVMSSMKVEKHFSKIIIPVSTFTKFPRRVTLIRRDVKRSEESVVATKNPGI